MPYRAEGIADEHHQVFAVLSWCADAAGRRPIQRDYAHREKDPQGGMRLGRVLSAPEGAVSLRIELGLRGGGGGTVLFFEPGLARVSPGPSPRVRVAVTHGYPGPAGSHDQRLEEISRWIDEAAAARASLIILPETIFDYGIPGAVTARTRELAGRAADLLSRKAREHRVYLAAGAREVSDGVIYNVALLYDRAGRLAGRYRKVHVPLSEAEAGVAAGGDFPVFETDFGTVGLLVCWDLWFPESARILR
ncbi:MAG: carbon-nitrogen hydrolase family protein, partial [Bryobacteraceae bacterium]